MTRVLCVVLTCWLSIAEAREPALVTSELMTPRTASFVLRGGEGAAYELAFTLRSAFAEPVWVTVDFEDPADPQTALFQELGLPEGQVALEVRSPFFRAVRNRKDYAVKVWVYEDALRRKLIGTHEQRVESQVPGRMLDLPGIETL